MRIVTIAIFLLLAPHLSITNSTINALPGEWYRVVKVVDGDTFWAETKAGNKIKIRLIGIDAPELHNTRSKPKGYFASESTGYLAKLIGGKEVRLEYDVAPLDRYGRTLAYVYLKDGTFVNADLVRNGYALVMTVPPNVKYADTFVQLAAKARKQGKGLWEKREAKK